MPDVPAAVVAQPVDVAEEAARLDREAAEIELLVQQARLEAGRHESRRAQAAERLAALDRRPEAATADYRDAAAHLLTASGRAALMDAQIQILEGKHRVLGRFRDTLRRLGAEPPATTGDTRTDAGPLADAVPGRPGVPPATARAILSAQEDLRRDIARALHDGPAQSLTNIVLQAEIAHRVMDRDPGRAAEEVAQLVRMVQGALDATKDLIFDVRPMVLDDLGLVPTLRRAALDRGTRSRVPISFESAGQDRRLAADMESGLFRILDDALVGFLAREPQAIAVVLDWSADLVRGSVRAAWAAPPDPVPVAARPPEPAPPEPSRGRFPGRRRAVVEPAQELPPALAAMIQRRQDIISAESDAAAAVVTESQALPPAAWHEIEHRAATLGVAVRLMDAGRTLEALAATPPDETASPA